MTLYEQILAFYPQLTESDFVPYRGTIELQDDSDGLGDYIAVWNNPLPHPPFGYDPHKPQSEVE